MSRALAKAREYVVKKLDKNEPVWYIELAKAIEVHPTTANQLLKLVCLELQAIYERGICLPDLISKYENVGAIHVTRFLKNKIENGNQSQSA